MMLTTRDTKGHTQMCLTFIFKVNHQGQVTGFEFSEILNVANVRIDTKTKSVACIQPEIRKVIQLIWVTLSSKVNRQSHINFSNILDILDLKNVRIDTKIKFLSCLQPEIRKVMQLIWVTLSSKVNRQSHINFSNIFDILDLENVRIVTKIKFVSCLQPEIRKVMQKGVWSWFSRSCNKEFSLSPLDSLTSKTYPWEIFSQNSDGNTKIQGGCINPLGRPKVDFHLGHPRVKCWNCSSRSMLLV